MNFQDEITSMERAIVDLVSVTLSSIGLDVVLDEKFKTFFLDCAKSKLLTAYNAYVIQAEFGTRTKMDRCINKIANVAQETLVSGSVLGDDNYDDDDIGSKGSSETDSGSLLPIASAPDSIRSPETELKLQNQFRNTLVVSGLPIRSYDEKSLLSLFNILCDHIVEPVEATEIENIQSDGKTLTVTFHDHHKKDAVQKSHRAKNLKANDFLKLLPGEISTTVKILEKRTYFYKQLCFLANDYVKKHMLLWFKICSKGLATKLSPGSPVIYVRSQNELIEHIVRNEVKRKRSAVDPQSTVHAKRPKS